MYNILAVDDEPDILFLYKTIINLRGKYTLLDTASNGEEAVQKYKAYLSRKKVDLVIMDHRMPVMDGLKATRKILAMDREAKIKFVSADLRVKKAALEAGAVDFVEKPLLVKALIRNIEEVLDSTGDNNMP